MNSKIMMGELLNVRGVHSVDVRGVHSVDVQENNTFEFDPFTQIPAMSMRVIIRGYPNLKVKKIAKIIEKWRFLGQATVGNTDVEFKCKLGGFSKNQRIKFEWMKMETSA